MTIDGHYDRDADIAWLRCEGYDGGTVVSEEASWGLRDLDPATRQVVGLEFWHASESLPDELLAMLPAPPIGVVG